MSMKTPKAPKPPKPVAPRQIRQESTAADDIILGADAETGVKASGRKKTGKRALARPVSGVKV
jgi:hypothetical protein